MAVIKPFKAWRPSPGSENEIASVPYDVITTAEARSLAEGNPNSFLRVIRPEIDLPEDTYIHDAKVYEQGKLNLDRCLSSGKFIQDQEENLYIYRLIMDGRSQAGIFGCVSVSEYEENVILKHEKTRPDKEDDRTKHIITQQAHAEPVMITFKDQKEAVTDLMNSIIQDQSPIYDMTAVDGVQHTIWKVKAHNELCEAFKAVPNLYIADGHHRCASAARVAREMESHNPDHTGEEGYNFFPAVLFPMNQMEILPYNRIVYDLPENFHKKLTKSLTVTKVSNPVPDEKGSVCIYTDNNWHKVTLPESNENDPASDLDVSRLQEFILEPLLGITDQRTDSNLDFVGGIRGTDILEEMVDNGEAALAISMYPTSIEELIDVSDAGLLMPPKSTWFEPKLRSGLLVHTFN